MSTPEIRTVANTVELAKEAAELFVWFGQQAIARSDRFQVALSGGSTPKALYSALASPEMSRQLDWDHVEFFFGDERCVPPEHEDSNYRLAHDGLFSPLKISADRIFRMYGEMDSPDEASRSYEDVLRNRFGVSAPDWPRFHLILLGLGDDGHTASLFPGTPALREETRLVVPSMSPKGIAQRLTFTAPLINHAEAVMFLVSGTGKASPVRDILEPRQHAEVPLPASLVKPEAGRLLWILDRGASAQLTMAKQQVVPHEE